jgi:hypothetical protein
MTPWGKGSADIDALIAGRFVQPVAADRNLADLMIAEARRHCASAKATIDGDPTGSFSLAYDASRKALAAILENQGLRATTTGGHRAIEDALRAQLVPPMNLEIDGFGWMRTLRNSTQYPTAEKPLADRADAAHAHGIAQDLIAMAEKLLDAMPVYRALR